MNTPNGSTNQGCANHPIVWIAGFAASVIGIFAFVTGISTLRQKDESQPPAVVVVITPQPPSVITAPPVIVTVTPQSEPTRDNPILNFQSVPLSQYANCNIEQGYTTAPIGKRRFRDIPFDIPNGKNCITTQAESLPDNPTFVSVSVNVNNPKRVYLLLTGGNTFSRITGEQIGLIQLHFEAGQDYSVPLIAGQNIREWQLYNEQTVGRTTANNVEEVWHTPSTFGGTAIIDLMTIDLPSVYYSDRLVSIDIDDQSVKYISSRDPAINLLGLTVAGK